MRSLERQLHSKAKKDTEELADEKPVSKKETSSKHAVWRKIRKGIRRHKRLKKEGRVPITNSANADKAERKFWYLARKRSRA